MIIAETILVPTLLTSVPKKPKDWAELHYVCDGKTVSNCFVASSGVSVERKLTNELEKIDGVGAVEINQSGNSYRVNITMDSYDFSKYERVIAKELEMFDKIPGSKFVFNVTFAEHAVLGDSALNVA
jgi:hypothetical protein